MENLKRAANQFLSGKSFAIAGVSKKGDTAANIIYRKLRDSGYEVYAINPNAQAVEGDPAYPNLRELPCPVDGVIIGTHPGQTPGVIRQCAELNIRQVWIHRSIGQGSFHPDAIGLANELNLKLIPGGCPMMFQEPVDIGHKCLRWFLGKSSKEITPVGYK